MRVVINGTTKSQAFPAGTEPQQPFLFTIRDKSGAAEDLQQKSFSPSATFDNVPAGDYTAVMSAHGVEASQDFSVAPDASDERQVPDTITVMVGDSDPAARRVAARR
jgi:hypothetical protein